MKEAVEKLMGKLIVSCQAYEDTPFYGPSYMKAMAESVLMGGAQGIRACWPQDIRAIRSICRKPIVGIYKDFPDGDPLDHVFITSTFEQAKAVIDAGADILGIDCTIRKSRGLSELSELLGKIKESYPDMPIMADLATAEEGIALAESKMVDIISTTLNGYTRESLGQKEKTPNVRMVRELKKYTALPVNAEGRIWTPEDLECVLDAGADMVTIGTAITRPHLITERFMEKFRQYKEKG